MVTFLPTAIGLILTAFVLLQQIALWQRKEYRVDRLLAEVVTRLRSRRWWLWATLVMVGLVVSAGMNSVGWSVLGLVTAFYVYQIVRRGFFKPRPTLKVGVILFLAVVIMGGFGFFGHSIPLATSSWWSLMIVVTPLAVALAVLIGNSLGDVQKKRIITQASRHRQALTKLTVIGITGSYGKTSTKYFVHHLMSDANDQVIMSAERRNEVFVIAQDLLKRVTAKTTTYIVEMGAYRRGEIAHLARLAKPTIGVVTAISNQHLALFGSLVALAAAKWELIESLPADGCAVLNADDRTIQKQAADYHGKIVWYSVITAVDVYATEITIEPTRTTFTLHIKNESQTVTLCVAGAGYVGAAVAAAATAYAAGTSAATIFSRLPSLKPIPQTMVVSTNSRGNTIIDDSYSANEPGVLMALEHLARFSQAKKVVVLRPLIELGAETQRVHTTIGQALVKSEAMVFLYDTAGAAEIEQAVREAGSAIIIHRISSPKALAAAITAALDADTVCLLENRLPAMVRQAALA